MKGDYTRLTFDPTRGYTRVLLQQGRVQVDADANEEEAIAEHLRRLECIRRVLEHPDKADDELRLAANMAKATHGEMHVEVLGGGGEADSGIVVTLGKPSVLWEIKGGGVVGARSFEDPTAALETAGLSDFTVTAEPDGSATLTFGDGQEGARPPSSAVVVSTYRMGGGEAGNVAEGQLSDRIPCWLVGMAAGVALTAVLRRISDRSDASSDEAISILERLAYVADRLSYYQDAIASEGYLGTARRRRRRRRH